MKKKMFSLVELLVVIGVIAILAGLLFPVINSSRKRARKVQCLSNLKQFGLAFMNYRNDFSRPKPQMPPWLSTLYGDYIKSKDIYRCSDDKNDKATAANDWLSLRDGKFDYAYDRPGNAGISNQRNSDIDKISYFYEMTDTTCDWDSQTPKRTWNALKTDDHKLFINRFRDKQNGVSNKFNVVGGDEYIEFDETDVFPVLRCTWHYEPSQDKPYLNVSWEGRVFLSRPSWEKGIWDL